MGTQSGYFYNRLAEAVASAGSPRSVYSQDTTLSRRGLLTRADRRARELSSLGVGSGDIVALSMGNVVELLVLLLACSKSGAIPMPIDPANGERTLLDATARLPVRAVVRRPRGDEATAPDYPQGYKTRSRRRLSSSLLTCDVLDPGGAATEADIPAGSELVLQTLGIGGVARDIFRGREQLEAVGRAAVACLELDAGSRLLCAQPLVVPRFFVPVLGGWLASEAQLVMAEGPALESVLPIARNYERLVVFDSVRQFVALARGLKASGASLPLTSVIPQATVPLAFGRAMQQVFGERTRQLLLLEEVGILASRVMQAKQAFVAAPGVELRPGPPMEVGGQEVLVRSDQATQARPPVAPGEPGSISEDGFVRTGYAGRWGKQGALLGVIGRDDGLVNIEGRRACLDSIEEAMVEHRRVTWVRALLDHTADGDPIVVLEYEATGQTEVDDIEEHAVGHLPPFMVPRSFVRVTGQAS